MTCPYFPHGDLTTSQPQPKLRESWKRQGRFCWRVQRRHSTGVAKVAVARKLALRRDWMRREGRDYAQLQGPYAGKPVSFCGPEAGPAA
jgi:hypothetical protein